MPEQVQRRRGLTHRAFVREHLTPLKPVILVDAIDRWPALGKWTVDFFRQNYGQRSVTIDGRDHQIGSLMDHIERSTSSDPAP